MKPCIVSFSSYGRENYNQAMLRLIKYTKDLDLDYDYELFSFDGYVDEYLGVKIHQGKSMHYPQPKAWKCYNHSEVPYQFKPAMFQIARESGHDQVLWFDSTICMVKDPQPLLDLAKEQGVVVFDNLGHPLANWISDLACERLGVKDLRGLPQIMACCIIFDFSNPVGLGIFNEWVAASQDGVSFQNYGSVRPDFRAHRHDQAILSYLCFKNGIQFLPYGSLVYQPHDTDHAYGDGFYFVNKGI